MNLIEKAKSYSNGVEVIRDWLGDGGVTVSQHLAQTRTNVCLVCPKHINSGVLSGTISEAVKRQVEIKNNLNLRVVGEKSIGKCGVCMCELKLKNWIPLERVLPDDEERYKYPENCWLITESKK